MGDFLDVLDIVLYLTAVGASEADDPADPISIDVGDVVENVAPSGEGDVACFTVVLPIVDPV